MVSDKWAIVILTAGLVVTSCFQWNTMRGQLSEMTSAGKQTDRLIQANFSLSSSAKKQADAALKTANAVKEQVDQLKTSISLQASGIKEQIKSVKAQSKALELQKRDIYFNYKPVVYIKTDTIPTSSDKNPYDYDFVLTNSGKLPARKVRITVYKSFRDNSGIIKLSATETPTKLLLLDQATVYPGSSLTFWLPKTKTGSDNCFIELKFNVTYSWDGMNNEMKEPKIEESMNFIYCPAPKDRWFYVGPDVKDICN
jgi:hypothetical protein